MVNWSLTKKCREYNGEGIIFSTNGVGLTGHPHTKKKMNLNIDLMPITKTNSKTIIDLNVKCKTRILPEDNIREKLVDLEVTMTFRYNTKA